MSQSPANTKKKTESLLLVVAGLLVFLIATITPTDADMWWHLRAGDEMWHQGRILLEDIFSYTRYGAPWVNAFWLSDIGLYGLWKAGGFFAITVMVALIAVMVMSIVYRQMEGAFYLRVPLILLAMIGMQANWSARPQLLSFVLLALLDYFLYLHRTVRRQPLWVLVLIFAAWGNLHGGFIWGILVLLATIAGEALDNLFNNRPTLNWKEIGNLALWSVLAGLAVSINPNGISLWRLPFYQVQVSLSITEWLSPDFHQSYAHPLLWLLFLLIAGIAYSGKRMSFADLLKALGFTYLFFVAQRNMGPYAIILLPIIARNLDPALQSFSNAPIFEAIRGKISQAPVTRQPSARFNFIVNTALISLLVAFVLVNAYIAALPQRMEERIPARAVQWIKDNKPPGPIFNSYNWGGYLIWELREYPVFIDGRADLYGDEILSEWSEIINGTEKGLALLDKHRINLVFLEPKYALLEKLSERGWEKVFSDSQITIYRRQPPVP
jgi:hypothetical protein